MRLLFVGYNLRSGGVQRALINTIKYLADSLNQHQIDLFLFSYEDEWAKEIPSHVNIIKSNYLLNLVATPFQVVLAKKNPIKIILRIILTILVRIIKPEKFFAYLFRRHNNFTGYDIAVSYFNDVSPYTFFNRGCNQFVTDFVEAKKKIAWIHSDPEKIGFYHDYCLKTYEKFDNVILVSEACRISFNKIVPELKDKTYVVYNLFPIEDIRDKAVAYQVSRENNKLQFITVARIDNKTKRIDRAIEVCKILNQNNIRDFKWIFIGDGPDLSKNRKLVKKYGVSHLVEFLGEKSNPFPYIASSDLFVLTSDYEGFPMVVGEAHILGVPVISTEYIAVNEQITDGKNGIIVSHNSSHIAQVLTNIIEDNARLHEMKDYLIKNPFSNSIAINQLSKVFELNDDRLG